MNMKKLSESEVNAILKDLDGWVYLDLSIAKEFAFGDFTAAMDFINKVAVVAQKLDHHPDILLYSYNKVKLYNSTHTMKGVTIKDIELAREIQDIN